MSIQKAHQRTKISRRGRQGPEQRPGQQVQNGQPKAGLDPSPIDEPGFHLLGKDLRPITRFESFSTSDPEFQSLLRAVDTEEKQLQAIGDLYLVLKAQPKYKNLKEPRLTVDARPLDVLRWILRKLGPLSEGNHWTVDTYRSGSKLRYRFVVYKHFTAFDLKHGKVYFPFDFLPALKNRDLHLHDLIIDVFALVSRCNKLPIWDEDGDYADQLKKLRLEKKSTGNGVLDAQIFSYTKGPAAQYLALLKQRRKMVTVAAVRKRLNAYVDDSDRKGHMKIWLRKGLYVAQQRRTIEPWSYVPHHLPGNPVGPQRQYKVVWSVHDNDVIHSRASSRIKKDRQSGDYFPVIFTAARPGERLKPAPAGSDFPSDFYWFLEIGRRILFTRYHEYFYKQAFKAQETPAEAFLQRIEAAELRATI
jgi:hypothetical protein